MEQEAKESCAVEGFRIPKLWTAGRKTSDEQNVDWA